MYNSGRDGRDSGENSEKEVASRNVQVQSKRFYLDVKQNRRGRFLKIAEVGASGHKSRILMSMSATPEFRDKLSELVKYYKQTESSPGGEFKFRSENLARDNRRYYLDLKENQRGRFLRIAQQVSPSGCAPRLPCLLRALRRCMTNWWSLLTNAAPMIWLTESSSCQLRSQSAWTTRCSTLTSGPIVAAPSCACPRCGPTSAQQSPSRRSRGPMSATSSTTTLPRFRRQPPPLASASRRSRRKTRRSRRWLSQETANDDDEICCVTQMKSLPSLNAGVCVCACLCLWLGHQFFVHLFRQGGRDKNNLFFSFCPVHHL